MRITTYGTRGSVPISNNNSVRYGGNTTSLRIESACLPEGRWLVIDTGSGFVPLAMDAVKAGVQGMSIFYTHYHHDHTIGITLAAVTFMKAVDLWVFGVEEKGFKPQDMLKALLQPPLFPVDFKEVASHFHCHSTDYVNGQVAVIHPQGGIKLLTVEQFETLPNGQVSFKGEKFAVDECLVIRMHRSHHPEQTISYRFEERPTGKVFTFLTDHENTDGLSKSLLAHVRDSDLLIEDCQYDEETYMVRTAGFGHATPRYVVNLAVQGGVKRLGLTHHDPSSTDEKIDAMVLEAQRCRNSLLKEQFDRAIEGQMVHPPSLPNEGIFACADYQVIDV